MPFIMLRTTVRGKAFFTKQVYRHLCQHYDPKQDGSHCGNLVHCVQVEV